jgi:translocation and assembly module TamB
VVEDIALDIDLMRLASREFRISNLSAGRVAFSRPPVPDPAAPPAPASEPGPLLPQLPQLPLEVALERIALPRIELGEAVAGFPAQLSLEAGGRLGADGAFIGAKGRRLDAPGTLDLDLALAPGDRVKIDLNYDEARRFAHVGGKGEAGGVGLARPAGPASLFPPTWAKRRG